MWGKMKIDVLFFSRALADVYEKKNKTTSVYRLLRIIPSSEKSLLTSILLYTVLFALCIGNNFSLAFSFSTA